MKNRLPPTTQSSPRYYLPSFDSAPSAGSAVI